MDSDEAIKKELARLRRIITAINGDNVVLLDPEQAFSPKPPSSTIQLPEKSNASEAESDTDASEYDEGNVAEPTKERKNARMKKTGKGTTRSGRKGSILSNRVRVSMAMVMANPDDLVDSDDEPQQKQLDKVKEVATPDVTPKASSRTLTGNQVPGTEQGEEPKPATPIVPSSAGAAAV